MKSPYKYFLFTFILVLIDQGIKLWMHYVILPNGSWQLLPGIFSFHYVLNPGMAFGLEIELDYGKLFLSIFRLAATIGIGWYILHLANKKAPDGLIWSIAAILGGALGNVIDSTFYGVFIEGNMIPGAPTPWFHGQVIDMFYFEFFDGFWPDWIPFFGGSYNSTPIFNFADACIFCGVASILIFQQSFLDPLHEKRHHKAEDETLDSQPVAEDDENPEENTL